LTPDDQQRLLEFGARHAVQWWLQPGGPDTVHRLTSNEEVLAYQLPEFGVDMPFKPTDFTQVNPMINRVLVQRAIQCLEVSPTDQVIDWFCGLGNFTLPLARLAREVMGIEGSRVLVERAQVNAIHNGLSSHTAFEVRNLFELSASDLASLPSANRWLIDPPREGAFALAKALADLRQQDPSEPQSEALAWKAPQRLVYVSCNPATLARDAGLIVHQAKYRCVAAGVVNMFPHTAHVESMAVFELA
jgi:23S rRNA (uracil1939-C5)-methyltransferase